MRTTTRPRRDLISRTSVQATSIGSFALMRNPSCSSVICSFCSGYPITIGPRRRTPLGGRTNRGFGAGFTFSGCATWGLAAFAAFSFFGLAAFSFFVGMAGASTAFVAVGIAEANGGSGGGASRTGASGAAGATGAVYAGGVYAGGTYV